MAEMAEPEPEADEVPVAELLAAAAAARRLCTPPSGEESDDPLLPADENAAA
ncbi:hypothetical protein [Streptacidiphilus monticola]|jgi:hypothetical protein|uniref:Uncharacterized protein n=1 Tax=Streptacidiphilus monticola TaxID=2161674 RepID=A0ABW1FXD1_9ACTN